MRVQTFTEFVGELPEFDSDEALEKHLFSLEDEYHRRHKPDRITRARAYIYGHRGPLLKRHASSDIGKLDEQQKRAYTAAYRLLNVYMARRKLCLRLFRGDILDFGCGSGGPSIFLHNQGGNVTAIDTNEKRIDELKKTGLFPEEKAKQCNGLDYMLQQPESSFDLIVAMHLGRVNCYREFIEQFHYCSTRAVKPDGAIFVESDRMTMDTVRGVFGVRCPPFASNVMVYRAEKQPGRQ